MTEIPDRFWGGYGNGILGGVRGGRPISNPWGMKNGRRYWSDTARINPRPRLTPCTSSPLAKRQFGHIFNDKARWPRKVRNQHSVHGSIPACDEASAGRPHHERKITRLRFVPSVCPEGMEALTYSKSADKRSWEHMKVFFKEIFGGK